MWVFLSRPVMRSDLSQSARYLAACTVASGTVPLGNKTEGLTRLNQGSVTKAAVKNGIHGTQPLTNCGEGTVEQDDTWNPSWVAVQTVVPGAGRAQQELVRFGGWMNCRLETLPVFSPLGSSATALTFFVAVALTNLEDTENARRAYTEAVRLDK